MELFGKSLIDQMTGVGKADAMSESQVNRESGGRQFDKNGKPLVGRYRDGTMPAVDERAYGVAQMQLRTGRNVAEAHGVTWDENKFMTDAKYNKLLGDYHMNDLERKYGNKPMAEAAYHSGEPRVDRAIARYGRENFHRGLGPEGRAYIGRGGGGGGSGSGSGRTLAGTTPVRDISQTQMTPAEGEQMADKGVQVFDPFAAEGRVGAAATEQNRRSTVADAVLAAAVNESNAVRQQETQALESTVAAKDGLIDHQRQITEEAIKRTTPIFQKRTAIADRMVELQEMNPIERTFKSIFNPNYNESYLEGSDRNYARQLDAINQGYAQDFELHGKLMQLSQADYENQDQLFKLQLANFGQDIQNAVMSWQSSSRMLSSEMDGLQANSAVIAAQTAARNDIYNGLTDGQLNDLIGKAGASGVTDVNGIEVRLPELTQIRQTRQEQAYSLQARQLALESQNLALAENMQDKILGTMTQPQIEEAINAKGVFQGQQFDLGKLGAALQQRIGTTQQQTQGQMIQDAAGTAGDMLTGFANQVTAYSGRAISIFGKVPDEYNATTNMIASQLRVFTKGAKEAAAAGRGAEYVAANMPMIQGLIEANSKAVDAMAKRWAGGNQYAESVARSWIKGEPLDSGAAMRGMIHFARNGLPAGTTLDQTSRAVFNAVQQEVRKDSEANPNDPIDFMTPGANKGDKAQREQQLIQRIQQRIGSVYNSQFVTNLHANAPALAKGVMVNGQPHPASRIDMDDWRGAIQRGDVQGRAARAEKLGMRVTDYEQMLREGPASQLAKTRNIDLGQERRELVAEQNFMAMKDIDRLKDTYGFSPSQVITNLWHNPQFMQMAENQSKIQGQGTFGGFLTSSASAGSVHNAVQNFADGWSATYNTRQANIRSINTQRADELAYDPLLRTQYMLGAVDGLSEADEKILYSYIQQKFSNPVLGAIGTMKQWTLGAGESAGDVIRNSDIDSWIMTGKADDPNVERVRRHAARSWGDISTYASKIAERMAKGNK